MWAAVDPYTHIGGNPDLEIHLVHGDDTDEAWYEVARSASVDLHAELVDAGYDVELMLNNGSHTALVSEYQTGFAEVVELAVQVANG